MREQGTPATTALSERGMFYRMGWHHAVQEIACWLRGDEGEAVRTRAMQDGIPPEDALAHEIELKWGPRGGPANA